jgi:hypothetical protein
MIIYNNLDGIWGFDDINYKSGWIIIQSAEIPILTIIHRVTLQWVRYNLSKYMFVYSPIILAPCQPTSTNINQHLDFGLRIIGHLIWLVVWNNFYFSIYIGNNNPNWLSYFSAGLKPPTRLVDEVAVFGWNPWNHLGNNLYHMQPDMTGEWASINQPF